MPDIIPYQPQQMTRPVSPVTDDTLVRLWVATKRSPRTQAAYAYEAARFLAFVARPLGTVTLQDVLAYQEARDGKPATVRRSMAAVKSLLAFGQETGYLPFNVGAALKMRNLKDSLSERILDEETVGRIIALEPDTRNRALLRLLYASGGRVSEIVDLRWRDVTPRAKGQCQLTLFGKGAKTRNVLLPAKVARDVLALRNGATTDDPVFRSRKGGALTRQQAWRIVRDAARRAGVEENVSPHWFRHAHVSHALDRGAPAHLVQGTVGHASLDTTTKYAHARPDESSATYLPL